MQLVTRQSESRSMALWSTPANAALQQMRQPQCWSLGQTQISFWNALQATEVVISALVAVENSQPEVARLLLDVAAAILQAGQVGLSVPSVTSSRNPVDRTDVVALTGLLEMALMCWQIVHTLMSTQSCQQMLLVLLSHSCVDVLRRSSWCCLG